MIPSPQRIEKKECLSCFPNKNHYVTCQMDDVAQGNSEMPEIIPSPFSSNSAMASDKKGT